MRSVDDDLCSIAEAAPLVALLRISRSPHEGTPMHMPPGPRIPIREGRIDLLDDVHAKLVSWVRMACEDYGLTDWPADAIPAMCQWLRGHHAHMDAHPARIEFVDEMRDCWRRMRNAIGERPPSRPQCTGCGAKVRGHGLDGDVTYESAEKWRWCSCPDCGMTFTFDAELKRLGAEQQWTLAECAAELEIPYGTARRWKHEGLVRSVGRDNSGRPLFDLEQVRRVAERTG